MTRPSILSLSEIVAKLTPVAQSPSVIATSLGVSRATLHRKLTQLLDQGLIVNSGQGRHSSYRLPSPLEELERAHQSHRKHVVGKLVRLDMNVAFAQLLRSALENMARICIGQLEQMDNLLRWDTDYETEQIKLAGEKIKELKFLLLSLSSGASHGIFSSHVSSQIKTCWAIHRAIRHRLAWDRTPAGSMGVDFDEPILESEKVKGLVVLSSRDDAGETRITTEMSMEAAQIVAQALRCQSRLASGDFTVAVDLARDGLVRNARGELVSEGILLEAYALANSASALLGISEEHLPTEHSILCVKAAEVIEQVVSGRDQVHCLGNSMENCQVSVICLDGPVPKVSLASLPEGYFVRYDKNKFRVIGPCENPDYLRVISESHSLQTVMLMALNKCNDQPGRSW